MQECLHYPEFIELLSMMCYDSVNFVLHLISVYNFTTIAYLENDIIDRCQLSQYSIQDSSSYLLSMLLNFASVTRTQFDNVK